MIKITTKELYDRGMLLEAVRLKGLKNLVFSIEISEMAYISFTDAEAEKINLDVMIREKLIKVMNA